MSHGYKIYAYYRFEGQWFEVEQNLGVLLFLWNFYPSNAGKTLPPFAK
jgi:hypothetical protein